MVIISNIIKEKWNSTLAIDFGLSASQTQKVIFMKTIILRGIEHEAIINFEISLRNS